ASADEHVEGSVEACSGLDVAVALCFGKVPRADVLDVAVGLVHDVPHGCGRGTEVEVVQSCRDLDRCLLTGGDQPARISDWLCRSGWRLTIAVSVHHARYPIDEIAQIIGEVAVGASDELVDGEVRVADPGYLAQQPPAHGIGTESGDEFDG